MLYTLNIKHIITLVTQLNTYHQPLRGRWPTRPMKLMTLTLKLR